MMKLRLAALALIPLALAACDDLQSELGLKPEPAPAEAATPLDQLQPPSVSPLQQPIEVAGSDQVAAVNANSETLNTTAFVARGNEPFWRIDISGNTAVYKTPENQDGRSIPVSRLVFAQGVEYVGALGDAAFALTIRGTDCVDDMSGENFPMTATLRIGTRSNNGCAAPAEAAGG